DHEPMLPRIDVRDEGATGSRHVVEGGWRDHSHLILKRSGDMKREPEFIGRMPAARRVSAADGGHIAGALAVFDPFLARLDELFTSGCLDVRWCLADSLCLADRRSDSPQRQATGHGGAALEESPSISLHASLLRKCASRKLLPAVKSIVPTCRKSNRIE